MSLYNRRSILLMTAAAPLVAGCGFEPVYGPDGGASGLLNNVLVDEPTNNQTYLLVRELEDRLGRSNGAETYGLSMSVKTSRKSVGKTVAQVTSRFDILGEATFALRNMDTREVVTSGKVDGFVGYSASGSTVSELAAESDAYERLMIILADKIVVQLQAYGTTNPL